MKVIFLAFAHSAQQPLPSLTEEDKFIYELLEDRAMKKHFFVHRQSFATIEDINAKLKDFQDELAIFHYSGHADAAQLLINNENILAEGIADQLKYSAAKGVLKLVILNGCATYGQVKKLKENGVPAVISTNAKVGDKAATAFSCRFWLNLVKYHMGIEEAYIDAIGPAKTVSQQDLSSAAERHLGTGAPVAIDETKPLWRLDGMEEKDLLLNPIPFEDYASVPEPVSNRILIETLYASFLKYADPETLAEHGHAVKESSKAIAIVNNIPNPIGIPLQRLICPTIAGDTRSPQDKQLDRLKDMGQLYQTTTEFLGIVMIAQVWELALRFQEKFIITPELKRVLNEYLDLDEISREQYNYIPLIQSVRQYLKEVDTIDDVAIKSFIDEQDILQDLFRFGDDFRTACAFLFHLHTRPVDTSRLNMISSEAEQHLLNFLKPLNFIYKYHLTSVQNIDILKFRHTMLKDTSYKHRLARCMQAVGDNETGNYYMTSFLDNWSVMLIKSKVERMFPDDPDNDKERATVLDALSLSPFMIDRNSFIKNTTLSYLMFYKGFKKTNNNLFLSFKRMMNPSSETFDMQNKDAFEPIRQQFEAFQKMITS
ncbi:MAG: hypothetical protein JWQ27_2507 [Ferruginibacter sp.]|nr:hypothetical protein [Ferruginibacter sp.]